MTVDYFSNVRSELNKVAWPSRHDTRRLTILCINVTIASAIFPGDSGGDLVGIHAHRFEPGHGVDAAGGDRGDGLRRFLYDSARLDISSRHCGFLLVWTKKAHERTNARYTNELTDYDPEPVILDEPSDDVEGLNITLDDGAEDDLERSWFFIHCYSGYEKKVEHALRQRIETMGMQDQIYDVLIPTEDEIEVKDGKRRTVEKRVFPRLCHGADALGQETRASWTRTPGIRCAIRQAWSALSGATASRRRCGWKK